MRTQFSSAGVLCTGGMLLVALHTLPLPAQQRADQSVEKSARVIGRGAHHATWETVRDEVDLLTGETNTVTSHYTQLETGLHYLDQTGGWVPASETIEVVPGFAEASEGRHQVRWAANINTYGAVELWTPEGKYAQSHVLGLAYFDPQTRASVMIAEIQDSLGYVAGNQVVYEDAFTSITADIRYTYTKGGFEQDVIVREKLPDPAQLGFDPATVQLQVLTEFVALPESATAQTRDELLSAGGVDPATVRGTLEELEDFLGDAEVSFGEMHMTRGRAFRLNDGARESAVEVRKKLETFEGGRRILVETVDVREVAPLLEELPELSKPTAFLAPPIRSRQQAALRVAPAAPVRQTADARLMDDRRARQLALNTGTDTPRGLVIDYTLTSSTNNLTLQSDTTYYVTGPVTATGVTTIEGGAIIKFAGTNGAQLKLQGTYNSRTAPFRPAIFTSAHDGNIGVAISYTNAATTYYATNALWIDSNVSDLRHLHIRHAWRGIYLASGASNSHAFTHVQLFNCREGLVTAGPTFRLRNALFNQVLTNFHSTASAVGHVEHLTANVASILKGTTSLTLNVTNSLLVQITNASTINSSAGNATYAASSGVFQTVGVGQHYLAVSSTNRNAGVTNISLQLQLDFKEMTTYPPPNVYSNLVVTTNMVWTRNASIRDGDTPDRGYHYTAADYATYSLKLDGSLLTLTNGVSVLGIDNPYFWPYNGGRIVSTGAPERMNTIGDYQAVQEGTNLWAFPFYPTFHYTIYARVPFGQSQAGASEFRFTRVPSIGENRLVSVASAFGILDSMDGFTLRDSEVWRATISQTSTSIPLSLTNNLFHRSGVYQSYSSGYQNYFVNNTFVGGYITNVTFGSYWTFQNNLFDRTAISLGANPVHSHNGYVTGFPQLPGSSSGNVVLTNNVAYEPGPYGDFYLGDVVLANATPALRNAGSTNAGALGLYHFTTHVDQIKDGASIVDIGYHYAAVSRTNAYAATGGFSSTQGANQWYYKYGLLLGTPSGNLTFDGANQRWNLATDYYAMVAKIYQHTGDTNDSFRTFEAPRSGVVAVWSSITDGNNGCGNDDGVRVRMLLNSTEVMPWTHVPRYSTNSMLSLPLKVASGDLIHFQVNKNANKDCDATVWNPVIVYLDGNSVVLPTDTDNDGIADIVEDLNGNGRMDAGESNLGMFTPAGATWKYLDNGSNQGTSWYSTSFNDTSWASGPAELGYGDGGEATVVSYGSNSNNKYITTYFRRTFNAAGVDAVPSLALKLKRDDGAVVYLNGVEVRRDNLPVGAIAYTTAADETIGGADESTFYYSTVPASALVNGVNVLATEIHQDAPTSTDISFDLELTWNAPPVVSWVAPANGSFYVAGTNLTLSAAAVDDLGVAKVVFYRGGVRIGESTTPSGGVYSLVWTNVPAGGHLLTARVIDLAGLSTTTTEPVIISVQSKTLLVVASTTLNAAETAISNRLVTLGSSVVTKTSSSVSTNDPTTATVTVVSSTGSSSNLTNKFRFTPGPVVIWKNAVFDDTGLTGTPGTEYGAVSGQTNLVMSGTNHPLAAGFFGTINATTNAAIYSWGKPNTNAIKVATIAGDSSQVAFFGYEKGAQMPGLVAPGRRVGFFLEDSTAASLSGNGWTLFDSAILWAGEQPCYPAVDVALVLDNSSSMDGQPLIDAKNAASNFVSRLEFLSDKGAVISFSSSAVIRQTLTNNVNALTSAINGIPESSGSRIDLGISTGRVQLASALHHPTAAKVMILLSDGKPSGATTNDVLTAANAAKADGVRIFTVGFGDIDATLLKLVASSPTDFFSAPSSADLDDLFNAIADAICRDSGNILPLVNITVPGSGQLYLSSPTNILMSITASDPDGSVAQVELFEGTNSLGYASPTTTNNVYSFIWENAPAGSYQLKARAADDADGTNDSPVVPITINALPLVQIVVPTNQPSYTATLSVLLAASATDADGSITNVAFYTSTNGFIANVTTLTNGRYEYTWAGRTNSHYEIWARAFDNRGGTMDSAVEVFTVNPTNAYPVVTLTAPTNGASYRAGQPIVLTATATDSNGIKLVEFFNGTNLLGSDSFAPYSFTIPFAAEGTYQFVARATDNASYRASSAIHSVTVGAPMLLSAEGYWDPAFGANKSVHANNLAHYYAAAVAENGGVYLASRPSSGGQSFGAKWESCVWNLLPVTNASSFGGIYAIAHVSNEVIYAGQFTHPNGAAHLAKRSGPDWLPVGDGVNGLIRVATYIDSNLVIGGDFTQAGASSSNKYVARLVGTNWTTVGNGLNGTVRAIATMGGDLYVGGDFTAAGGNTNISYLARLAGTNWVAVGTGVNRRVRALAADGNRLFVGGDFDIAGGQTNVNCLAVWNGGVWSAIGRGVAGGISNGEPGDTAPAVHALALRGNELYVGGEFTSALGATNAQLAEHVVKAVYNREFNDWDWQAMDQGVRYFYGSGGPDQNAIRVNALAIREHVGGSGYDVIVAGRFDAVGSTNLTQSENVSVARWVVGETDCLPNDIPAIGITAPATGLVVTNSITTNIWASASATGTNQVFEVQFFVNGQPRGGALRAPSPYPTTLVTNIAWSTNTPGFYELTAVVTSMVHDGIGGVTYPKALSEPVHVKIVENHASQAVDDEYVIFSNSTPTSLLVLSNDVGYQNPQIGAVWRFDNLVPFEPVQPTAGGLIEISSDRRNLAYTPRPAVFGRDVFIYQVNTGGGTSQLGKVTIHVRAKPEVVITSPLNDPQQVGPGTNVVISAASLDADGNVTNLVLRLNGTPIGTFASDTFTTNWTSGTPGHYLFTVEAEDNHDYVTGSEPVTVIITGNSTPPVALLSNLVNTNTTVNGRLDVMSYPTIRDGLFDLVGSAYDTDSASAYQVLLYRPDDQEMPFANVTPGTLNAQGFYVGSKTNESLGILDLTTVANGIYLLELRVRGDGQETIASAFVSIDSQLKLGQFSFSEQDLVIPVNGFPLTVIRTYDSQNHVQGDFGWNWTYAINDLDVVFDEERTPWPAFSSLDADDPTDGSVPYVDLRLGGGRNVTLTLPGGERATFVFTPKADAGNQRALARWTPAPGVTAKLEILGSDVINYFPWLHWFASGPQTPFDQYDIPGFVLTTLDGAKYEMQRVASPGLFAVENPANTNTHVYVAPQPGEMTLRRIVQRTGDTITITNNLIRHSFTNGTISREITFERDANGRITAVRDPLGISGYPAVKYFYGGASGNLKEVHKLVDRTTGAYLTNKYFYHDARHPHYLTSMEDARGKQVARQLFDDSGKLIGIVDASGRTNAFSYNLTDRKQVVTDRLGNPTTYQFDPRGNVTAVVNPLGQTNSFTHDDLGNVLTASDALGNTTENSYDAIGNLLSTTAPMPGGADPENYTTTFAYDQFGNQTNVTLPSGAVMASVFDANTGLLLDVKDGAGNLISGTRYNAFGQATNEFDLFGTNTFGYDLLGNATKFTNSLSQVITSGYDANGQLTNLLNNGVSSSFAYDALGRDRTADYGNGITLTNTYQAQLEWTNVAGPTIGTMGRSFDDHGRLAGWTTANGATPGFVYEENGRLKRETNSVGVVTEYAYDAAGRATNVVNLTTTASTSYGYDAAGRRFREINALGHTNLFDYWPSGSLKSMTNATGTNVWQYTDTGTACAGCGGGITNSVTDPLSRVTETVNTPYGLPYQVIRRASAGATNALAVTNSTTYVAGLTTPEQEAEDYPANITDEGGRTRNFGYTALGQLQWASDLGGNKWTNAFDAASGALLSVKSPTGATLSYTYDTLDNVKTITFADNGVLTNFYDAANRLHGVGLPNGQRLTNTFDFAGRLTNRTVLTGGTTNENIAFTYNLNDTLTSITDPTGLTTNRFDAAGRLSSLTQPTGATVGYELDVLGRVISVTNKASSGGSAYITRYKYDALGNVTNVVDPWSGNTYLEYDRVGRKTKRTLPSGFITEWQYDWKDNVTNIVHKTSGGTVRAQVRYERAAGSEPTKVLRDDNGSHSYVVLAYDGAFRLQSEAHYTGGSNGSGGTLSETITYTYDANGNRTKTLNASGTFTNAITGGFRLTAVTNTSGGAVVERYGHDAGGRVTNIVRSGQNFALAYNAADQLAQVIVTNGGNTTYAYTIDGAGRRVKATANGTSERRFLVAGTPGTDLESPHLIADAANDIQQGYVFLGDEPLMRYHTNNASTRVYYLEDGMGSIIGLADHNQTSVAEFKYDGFGQTRSATGSQVNPPTGTGGDFRFHGLWLETATSLYHVRARDYDPKTGRFLSKDPVGGNTKAPETKHPYQFSINNPFVASDPSGEFSILELNVVSAKQFTLQTFKTAAVNYAKRRAKNQIASAVSEAVGNQISKFFGFNWEALIGRVLNSATGGFDIGNAFGSEGYNLLCNTIGKVDGMRDQIHYAVRVSAEDSRHGPTGTPLTRGRDCDGEPNLPQSTGWSVGVSYGIPDFIIGDQPISSSTPARFGEALVVGEFKFSMQALHDDYAAKNPRKPEQFAAIVGYAEQYTSTRTAMFIVGHNMFGLPGGKASKADISRVKALMGNALIKRHVIPAVVTLVD